MNENKDKYELIKEQIIINLNNAYDIPKDDIDNIANEITSWLQEGDKREKTKQVTTREWVIISKIENQKLTVILVESKEFPSLGSNFQSTAKPCSFTILLEE